MDQGEGSKPTALQTEAGVPAELPLPTSQAILTDLGKLIALYEKMQRPRIQKYRYYDELVDDRGYNTRRLTALIPGFYDPEIEAVNRGEDPQFPDTGSPKMLV